MANLKTTRIQAAIEAVRLDIEDEEGGASFVADAAPQASAGDARAGLRAEIASLEKRRDALHLQIADLEARLKRLQHEVDAVSRKGVVKTEKEGTLAPKAPRRTPAARKPSAAPAAKDLEGLQKLKDAFAGFDAL